MNNIIKGNRRGMEIINNIKIDISLENKKIKRIKL